MVAALVLETSTFGCEGSNPSWSTKQKMIINNIAINQTETTHTITVGVTDKERWDLDIDQGFNGADAKTHIWVTLEDRGHPLAVSEKAGWFINRIDPIRKQALNVLPKLTYLVWKIKDQELNEIEAKDKYFGLNLYEIG